ncbi:MAG: 5-formyltetrahydrofolate cyclo-ligase [Candidatus Ratteibacteria bacterium]|nr:5-formyltetrahydrofolate cyclo-ligase [Candidatus Ratteibacteria bacterium]
MNCEKENKIKLRNRIKKLLDGSTVTALKEKSKNIQSRLRSLEEYKNSSFIMFYLSTEKEVSTFEAIETALSENKKVAVPLILKSQNIMLPCEIKSLKDLEPGPFGILQPIKEKIKTIPIKLIDLIVVPGLAFDKNGNRVGRGKGFYDKFLKSIPLTIPKIALAFSCQIVERIPTTQNDIAVDKIVTEGGVIECK